MHHCLFDKEFIVGILCLLTIVQNETSGECEHLQFANLGSMWIAECSFSFEFVSVYWLDSLASGSDPVVRYERGENGFVTSGLGYTNGTYNIQPNGLLVIPNVTMENERMYKAIVLNIDHNVFEFEIELRTSVSPRQTFPHVKGCEERTCVISYKLDLALECNFYQVRPPANLSWYLKTEDREEKIPSTQHTFPDGPLTYNSSITISTNDLRMQPFVQLVCRVSGLAPTSLTQDTVVLIDNTISSWEVQNPSDIVQKSITINTPTSLSCTYETIPRAFIWKRIDSKESTLLAFSTHGNEHVHITQQEGMDASNDGSLYFNRCGVKCEGSYMCVYNDRENFHISSYKIIVLIDPSPPYLIVDGCSPDLQRCKIHLSTRSKNLTCSVQNVYPELFLDLKSDFPLEITITKQEHKVKRTEFTFDVTVYAELRILEHFSCNTIHTVTCTAIGPVSSSFLPYKTIEVSYDDCLHPQISRTANSETNYPLAFGILGGTLLVIVTAAAVVVIMFKIYVNAQNVPGNLQTQDQNRSMKKKEEPELTALVKKHRL